MASTLHVSKPDKRRNYDDASKAEALGRARESRSTRAAARQWRSSEQLLCRGQPQPAVVEAGSVEQARHPAYRALRAKNHRPERERAILSTVSTVNGQFLLSSLLTINDKARSLELKA